MKLKHLLNESDVGSKLPKDKRDKLRLKMKELFDVIERFEENGEIHKDDKQRVETFKDFISDMIKKKDREDTIKGDG